MRRFFVGGLALLLATLAAAGVWQEGAGPSPEEEARIAELIERLADPEFATRDAATKALIALGEPALPALRKAAASSDDFETRWRAQEIVSPPTRKSKATGMELVLVKAGEFDMGSTVAEQNRKADETLHRVRISKSFYIGAYEVTQREYETVMEHNPSWFSAGGEGKGKVVGKDTGRYPVENVTWFDAIEFCNRLSEREGFEPYYRLSGVKRSGKSIKEAKVSISGGYGYRLPTEAEWEYACRAGTRTPYYYGGDSNARQANTKGVAVSGGYGGVVPAVDLTRTTDVGSYKPSEWGLFDTHGNAGEWVWDWYDKDYYAASPKADPTGPETGNQRVLRGGSWLVNEGSCRSASRFWLTPDESNYYTGFRVCRTP